LKPANASCMRKGDLLRCRFKFGFASVNDKDLLTIVITKGETKDYILMPLYIGGLGFMPPDFDYVLPGSYLPTTHPDFYRTEGGKFIYNGQQCALNCDKDFMYNGKYYLMPPTGNIITKTAMLRTEDMRNERIQESIGKEFDGELIEGIALEFLLRDSKNNELISVINASETKTVSVNSPKVVALIRDPITFVEYEFPVLYLKSKS